MCIMASCFKEAESGTESLLHVVEELKGEVTKLLDTDCENGEGTLCMKNMVVCTVHSIKLILHRKEFDILNEYYSSCCTRTFFSLWMSLGRYYHHIRMS